MTIVHEHESVIYKRMAVGFGKHTSRRSSHMSKNQVALGLLSESSQVLVIPRGGNGTVDAWTAVKFRVISVLRVVADAKAVTVNRTSV